MDDLPDLVTYLAAFGMDLADVEPAQAAMFVAARNLAGSVEGLQVPVAVARNEMNDATLTERETEVSLELTSYSDGYVDSRLPSDEMEVSLVRSVEDLPRIFPTQWLIEETQPEMFYSMLAGRELLVPEWQGPSRDARDSAEEVRRRELEEREAIARTSRQHAYVLLDTSRSMNDRDRRGTLARGLALAFLLEGYRQRARLNVRPFTADAGEFSSGASWDDLRAIAGRVIGFPNSGETRIQTALERAVGDIRQEGPCLRADILLITDGISRITTNPLAGEKLHTFLLGDVVESAATANSIRILREWSASFQRIWTNSFARLLAPTLADVQAAVGLLEAACREAKAGPDQARARRLRRLHRCAAYLLSELKRPLGRKAPAPPEIRALERRLEDAKDALDRTIGVPSPQESTEILDMKPEATLGVDQLESAPDTMAGGPPARRDPGQAKRPQQLEKEPVRWGRAARYVSMLALEAALGGFLLAYGHHLAGYGLAVAVLLGAVVAAANTAVLGVWAGLDKLGRRQRALFAGGIALGGAVACLGAGLTAYGPGWQLLVLAGTLLNMELASAAATLRAAGR